METQDYVIVTTYYDHGYHKEEETLIGFTYDEAWAELLKNGRRMDEKYAGEIRWSVFLRDPKTNGDYYEVFHERNDMWARIP